MLGIKSLILPLALVSSYSIASCNMNNGYVFCRSNDDRLLISPMFASGGGVNMYLYTLPTTPCNVSGQVNIVSSLYINNVLVQFGENCSSYGISDFPITINGSNYVINEFMTKRNVVLSDSYGKYITTFDATGFRQQFKTFMKLKSGRGGGL